MLKRLLSAFGGNKTKSSPPLTVRPPEATPIASASARKELITVYDAYGREMQITRGDWHGKVLLPNLEKNWNDPNTLYSLIVSALNDGFAADLLPAAQRLVAIDSNPERGQALKDQVDAALKRQARSTFRPGTQACFEDKSGRWVTIMIQQINQKTIGGYEIDTVTGAHLRNRKWRVGPNLLRPVVEPVKPVAKPLGADAPAKSAAW